MRTDKTSPTGGESENALRVRMEGLYRDIAPRLLNYLVANGSEPATAADIVQETFLRLWKMRRDLYEDPAQVSGLAFTTAKNIRTDRARRAAHEVLQADIRDEDADGGETTVNAGAVRYDPPAAAADTAFLRKRLTAAFAQLPPLLREAYTLFQIQDLPIREIARRTNATEALVKVRIFRAKEKLRPLLADLLESDEIGSRE